MIRSAALLLVTVFAAAVGAEPVVVGPVVVGPVELRAGESVEIDLYNAGGRASFGGMDLIDAASGRLLDRVVFQLPAGRGGTVGLDGARAFADVRRSARSSDTAVVTGVLWNGADSPPATAGEPRRVDADQKTIIGGFKSMSGMDSNTETVERRTVSAPIHLAGPAELRASALVGDGMALVELVNAKDGTVAVSETVQQSGRGYDLSRRLELPYAEAGPYVMRVTTLSGDVAVAVSVETRRCVKSIGCQNMSADGDSGAAAEVFVLGHEVAHVLQGEEPGL